MKNFLVSIIKKLIKILYILPIDDRIITFVSFHGDAYTCSPKYITEYLITNEYKYKIIWAFNNPKKFKKIVPKNVKCVKYKSFLYLYYIIKSRVRVNNAEEWALVDRRKGQLVINTWHGGGVYKRVAHASKFVNDKLSDIDYYNISNLFLSSCETASKYMYRDSFYYTGKILDSGLPRNDVIINMTIDKKMELKRKICGNVDKKIVLYAPTFRESSNYNIEPIDISRLLHSLEEKFGGEWIVWSRAHLATVAGTGFSDFFELDKCVDMSGYPDMQELLCVADVLVTDYSSSIWDFSFTGNPIFLYTPDLSQYETGERGFYIDIDKWKISYAQTNDELEHNINSFDKNLYKENIKKHHLMNNSYEKGTATKTIVDYINTWVEGDYDDEKIKGVL